MGRTVCGPSHDPPSSAVRGRVPGLVIGRLRRCLRAGPANRALVEGSAHFEDEELLELDGLGRGRPDEDEDEELMGPDTTLAPGFAQYELCLPGFVGGVDLTTFTRIPHWTTVDSAVVDQ